MGSKHNFVDLSTCTSRRKNQRVNFYEQKIPSLMDGEDGIPARAMVQPTPLDLLWILKGIPTYSEWLALFDILRLKSLNSG